MKIKILFLIDKLYPAGTQTNLLEIVKGLDRERFDPRVIALVQADEFAREFEAVGVKPIVLGMKKVFGPSGLKALSFLIHYLKTEEIDIVQTYFLQADILGSMAGKYARVKRIITTRRDEGFWRTKRQLMLNRYFNRFADTVLVNSQAVAQVLWVKEHVSQRKTHIIYNGVALNKYYPSQELREQMRQELGFLEDEFVVGMVANMRHEIKGHRYLLKAVSLLKKKGLKVKVLLVGDGPLEAKLESYAASRGIFDQVFFLGSRRDVTAVVNAMDVVCAPSLTEGFSNAILEAMAIGKPVIATNVGGNPEAVLYGETGFLVRPRDGEAIAEPVQFLMERRDVCAEMGAAGLARMRSEFSIEKMTKEYENFYIKLLETARVKKRKVRKSDKTVKEVPKSEELPAIEKKAAVAVRAAEEKSFAPPPDSYRKFRRIRVMHLIWSLDLGGAEQVVMNLVKKLDRQMFKTMVCCLNEKGRYASVLEQEGIKVFELRKKPKIDLSVISKLSKLLKEEKVDLLHTHLFTANLWGRIAAGRAKVPVISTEHNVDTWKRWFHFWLDRWLVKKNKKVIFVSKKVKEFYEEKRLRLNGKACVLYNGIDTSRFTESGNASEIRKRLGIAEGQKVIGIVGRLVPQKAHVDFIEAIKTLKGRGEKVTGLIVGDGPLRELLSGCAAEEGVAGSIIFSGFSSNTAELYRAMDVFVLSSLREGFPMTILEAMASGIPVVATDVGGVSECIKDGEHGLLVPAGNPGALAEAIAKILNDDALRNRFIHNSSERVKRHFSAEKMAFEHEKIYQEALGLRK